MASVKDTRRRFLVALYPRAWRERYGDELVALIETQPSSLRLIIDVLHGAFREQTRPLRSGLAKLLGTLAYTVALIATSFLTANLLFRFFQTQAIWLARFTWHPAPLAIVANVVAIGAPLIPSLPIADRYGPVTGTTIRNSLWIAWPLTIVATPIALWSVPIHGTAPSLWGLSLDGRANPLFWLVAGSVIVWLRRIGIEPPYRRRDHGPTPPVLTLR